MDFEGELQVLTPLDLASDRDFSFFLAHGTARRRLFNERVGKFVVG
jgi:hypothetical protein